MTSRRTEPITRKAIWAAATATMTLLVTAAAGAAPPANATTGRARPKLDAELSRRLQRHAAGDTVDLIATSDSGGDLPSRFRAYVHGERFQVIDAYWIEHLPVAMLEDLAAESHVQR